MADAELRAKARLEGGKETAQGLREIAEAEAQLRSRVDEFAAEAAKAAPAVKTLAEAEERLAGLQRVLGVARKYGDPEQIARIAGEMAEAEKAVDRLRVGQDGLNASTETYTSLAARLHPTLGALVDGMVKAGRVAGDWANQQINFREVTNKLTGAIRNNLNALKLMGAAGAVVAGIMAIIHAVKSAREEFERYTAAIKKNREELNKVKGEEEELEVAITKAADSRRRVAALTDEQARAATEDAKAIMRQYEALDRGTVTQTVGMLAGLGLSRKQLAEAAFLAEGGRLELSAEMAPSYMVRHVERMRAREAEWLEAKERRETEAGRGMGDISTTGGVRRPSRRQEAAFGELGAEGGSTQALQAFIRQRDAGISDEDAAQLADWMTTLGNRAAFEEALARSRPSWDPRKWGTGKRVVETGRPGYFTFTDEDITLDPYQIARMRNVYRAVEGAPAGAPQGGGVTINHYHHPRYYSPSARERGESRTGGQFMRDALEIG